MTHLRSNREQPGRMQSLVLQQWVTLLVFIKSFQAIPAKFHQNGLLLLLLFLVVEVVVVVLKSASPPPQLWHCNQALAFI